MSEKKISRRTAIKAGGAALWGLSIFGSLRGLSQAARAAESIIKKAEFVYCLNTGTIRGQKISIDKMVEIAAKAGYQAIEPWISDIEDYRRAGGNLADLRRKIADLGLTVESAIGFPQWAVDDDATRAKGVERAKYEMDLIAQIGGKRVAAPPSGVNRNPGLDLNKVAERYRVLLEAGDQIGVVPQLEFWGASANLNKLSQCMYVAMETGHPKACVLADVFHMYKGGSPFDGLALCSETVLQVFHMNDYPDQPPREQINDGARVMPGDGIAPMKQIIQNLNHSGGRKVLSLELFNKKYYEMDPLEAAKIGIEKMKAVVKDSPR
ncbi:MAG: sugar phosphate isomerase/epimerase [Verrucomicrobiae bacterium]|nr:sugar phosphate isomerase/epimerase [Verrucomicrobiae bacterium]